MNQDQLSLTFAALGDPTRRAILTRLTKGEASVAELSKPFLGGMSAPAITKHLKVLEKAGLISRGREAQWRPCKLNGQGFKEIADWVETYRKFWEESFDRLDEYLKTLSKAKETKTKVAKTKKKGTKYGRQK